MLEQLTVSELTMAVALPQRQLRSHELEVFKPLVGLRLGAGHYWS